MKNKNPFHWTNHKTQVIYLLVAVLVLSLAFNGVLFVHDLKCARLADKRKVEIETLRSVINNHIVKFHRIK